MGTIWTLDQRLLRMCMIISYNINVCLRFCLGDYELSTKWGKRNKSEKEKKGREQEGDSERMRIRKKQNERKTRKKERVNKQRGRKMNQAKSNCSADAFFLFNLNRMTTRTVNCTKSFEYNSGISANSPNTFIRIFILFLSSIKSTHTQFAIKLVRNIFFGSMWKSAVSSLRSSSECIGAYVWWIFCVNHMTFLHSS